MSPQQESGLAFWCGAINAATSAAFAGMYANSMVAGFAVFFGLMAIVVGHLKDTK